MFFSISQQPETNFSHCRRLGDFYVNTDAGWHETTVQQCQVVYKGYSDLYSMEDTISMVVDAVEPVLLGNFCAIVFDPNSNSIKIKTDKYRSFPMFFESGIKITNLTPLTHTVWADSLIEIHNDLAINETKFDIIGSIDTEFISVDDAIKEIDLILVEKTRSFLSHNKLPVKVFLSGGVDSLLVYSYLQRFTDQYELIKAQHFDYDKFWLKNSDVIGKFWGYKQLHHWTEPCVLTSGAPGDEFMLRSPVTTNLFLKAHGYDIMELLEQDSWKTCLHYSYFNQSKHLEIFQNQSPSPAWSRHDLLWNLCNILVNDWQHWHIGNTLTWTPLRDLRIIKLLLRLPVSQALGQIMNSNISRTIIESNYPGLSRCVSDQKNSGASMANLVDFYFNKSASSVQ
jgi:hypothetical protein